MPRKPKTPAQKRQAKEQRQREGAATRKQVQEQVATTLSAKDVRGTVQLHAKPIGFHPVTGEPIYANRGPRPKPEKKR